MKTTWLGVILNELIYGAAFSLCSVVTFGDVFFRKVKRTVLFPIASGGLLGIAVLAILMLNGMLNIAPVLAVFYLLHTLAAFCLLTGKNIDSLMTLICAEAFSGALIGIMQTAVFSVSESSQRSFLQVTLLYLASCLISAGFVFLLKRLVRSEDREPLGKLHILLLTGIVYTVSLLVQRSFAMSDDVPDVSSAAAIPSALMLMSVTALLLLSVRQQQAKRLRELHRLSEKYMTVQAKHFEQTREADTELRMLRHDMKNHITVMNGLFDSGKKDELGRYLKELSSAFAEIEAVNSIGNEIADAVISEKRSLAGNAGISLVTEGSLKGLDINAVTLCTVLSNLLDNAIEASGEASAAPVITLSAKRSGSFFYIRISNPTLNSIDVSGDIPTSKSDSAGHGLGLKSVKKAAEKCGGTLELSCTEASDGHLFTAEVILPAN